MDFSDFEEVDDGVSDGDDQDYEPDLSEALRKFEFEQASHSYSPVSPMASRRPSIVRRPWIGRGLKLVGVVDMGSNGIRFSITDLTPPLARILPPVFVYRSSISLYDSQFDSKTGDKIPIPDHVIESVCSALSRFITICRDFGTPKESINVIATEATRAAINSAQFLSAIKSKTDLDVILLPKEEEGQIGALGIASGFSRMEGLVMDLGGGSTQITWMVNSGSDIRVSPRGSFSFPYGAAALTKKLGELHQGKSKHDGKAAVSAFRQQMIAQFRDAYDRLQIPDELVDEARRKGGFRIYLSGGGFRGWGYLLLYMNQVHGKHYPFSIINGYTAGRDQFQDTETLKEVARAAKHLFRVSDRRRSQVPAVAFLVNVLAEAIPHGIRAAHFCQGGVREGFLYKQLPPAVRKQAPLQVGTSYFAPGSCARIRHLLLSSVPLPSSDRSRCFPEDFGDHVIDSFANSLYVHMFMSKESASTAALYSTSVGVLSTVHGVSHHDRARLALMLEARYDGELPPREMEFRESLRNLLTPEEVWWAEYLGKVGYLIATLYPAGKIDREKTRVVFSAQWSSTLGKKGNKEGVVLTIAVQKTEMDPERTKETILEYSKDIKKVGKKKNWIGEENPFGMKVKVNVVEEGILGDFGDDSDYVFV